MQSFATALQSNGQDMLMQRQIEVMLEMHTKKIIQELKPFAEAFQALGSEIQMLKASIRDLKESRPAVEKQARLQVDDKPQEPPQRRLTLTPETAAQFGGQPERQLQPGDISIEKMFYFGNKRR
ncbi:hypothetical protein HYU13_01050 [Candidatus Woesearchaeota archaeon]|nr:hypothetical protein [Candidatus Woesearchaeota archaeon]